MYEMQCCELIDESCCENDTKLQYWSKMQEKIRNIKKNLFKLEELIEENIEFLDGKLLEEHLNNKIIK